MPIIWISKVEAPKKVASKVPFDIYWREWFLIWPFKKYKIISRIRKKGDVVDCSYNLKHWWFWGYREHITSEWNGIEENTTYTIEVGHDR